MYVCAHLILYFVQDAECRIVLKVPEVGAGTGTGKLCTVDSNDIGLLCIGTNFLKIPRALVSEKWKLSMKVKEEVGSGVGGADFGIEMADIALGPILHKT
jgi:hypothetical protein